MNNKDLGPKVAEKEEGRKLRQYWRKLMNSAHNKISRGAESICKTMTCAQKDQWRRKNEKKKSEKS